ncbi:MAG: PIG-L family deacetylase [Actinomycetota bacterium]|nr:PIG-L family deacetylase [Actinomycetota bacterium]
MSQLAVDDLGTILSVWAHPDDEGYCCAGLMAIAAQGGQRVACVTATRGELGSTDPSRWPNGAELAAVRTGELAASLALLGVTEHYWLDYPDGGCDTVDQDHAIARLREILDRVQPDTVLTFGPDGATYHPDHMAVSRWVSAAVAGTTTRVLHQASTPEWQAEVDRVLPPELLMMADREPLTFPASQCALYVNLEGELLELKYRAMQCQESQVGPLLALAGPDLYRGLLAEEAFTDQREETA